jgi:predicted site-specific integrase-resolvase
MYSIGKFAKLIGRSIETLRSWDKQGKLIPSYRSEGGHRMYSQEQLNEVLQIVKPKERFNLGYIRVSAKHQNSDLERQHNLMELFLMKQGKEFQIISDIGSGINYNKRGLKELLRLVSTNQIDTLYISYKDRLVRFGYELIEEVCRLHNVKIVIINKSNEQTDEEELVNDILNIIHVFSCRIDGKRSHINKKIIEKLKNDK